MSHACSEARLRAAITDDVAEKALGDKVHVHLTVQVCSSMPLLEFAPLPHTNLTGFPSRANSFCRYISLTGYLICNHHTLNQLKMVLLPYKNCTGHEGRESDIYTILHKLWILIYLFMRHGDGDGVCI